MKEESDGRTANSKPIPLPFKKVIADLLKVKPLEIRMRLNTEKQK
jgi:hypothetical protein